MLLNGARQPLISPADVPRFLSPRREEARWSTGMCHILSIPLPAGLGQPKMRGD